MFSICDPIFCLEPPFYLMTKLETSQFQVKSVHSGSFSLHLCPGRLGETDSTSVREGNPSGPWLSPVHAGTLCRVFIPRSRQLSASLRSGIHRGSWVPIWPLIERQWGHLLLGPSSPYKAPPNVPGLLEILLYCLRQASSHALLTTVGCGTLRPDLLMLRSLLPNSHTRAECETTSDLLHFPGTSWEDKADRPSQPLSPPFSPNRG